MRGTSDSAALGEDLETRMRAVEATQARRSGAEGVVVLLITLTLGYVVSEARNLGESVTRIDERQRARAAAVDGIADLDTRVRLLEQSAARRDAAIADLARLVSSGQR